MYEFVRYIPKELRLKAALAVYERGPNGSPRTTTPNGPACALGVITGDGFPPADFFIEKMQEAGWVNLRKRGRDIQEVFDDIINFTGQFDDGELLGRNLASALGVLPEYLEKTGAV